MTVAAAAATGVATITTTTTSALQTSPLLVPQQPSRWFLYKLGNSLYVPLTSRCNSRTLPQLRGEGFLLPTPVVAALCRVRDAELHHRSTGDRAERKEWHDTIGDGDGDPPPKTTLPPPTFEAVATLPPLRGTGGDAGAGHEPLLPPSREPRLDDLMREIRHEFREDDTTDVVESIVVAGEGEPTLRLGDTLELVRRIKDFADTLPATQPRPAIRLTTNGLVVPGVSSPQPPGSEDVGGDDSSPPSLPQQLWNSGVSRVSVGLMTWNAEQYHNLVRPVHAPGLSGPGFDTVCGFIREAVAVDGDLEVETTAIDRPDVDKAKTEALAESLGVTRPVRWRPYFP